MEVFVGIDVAKDKLDVHLRPSAEAFSVARDGKGLAELVDRLRAVEPTLVVLEATGGYQAKVAAEIALGKMQVAVVNPRQARDFAKGLGHRAKTDPIDASDLAQFAEFVQPPLTPKTPQNQQELQDLVTRRRQLIQLRTREKNRLQTTRGKIPLQSVQQTIQMCDQQLQIIEQAIAELFQADDDWNAKSELLQWRRGWADVTNEHLIDAGLGVRIDHRSYKAQQLGLIPGRKIGLS